MAVRWPRKCPNALVRPVFTLIKLGNQPDEGICMIDTPLTAESRWNGGFLFYAYNALGHPTSGAAPLERGPGRKCILLLGKIPETMRRRAM